MFVLEKIQVENNNFKDDNKIIFQEYKTNFKIDYQKLKNADKTSVKNGEYNLYIHSDSIGIKVSWKITYKKSVNDVDVKGTGSYLCIMDIGLFDLNLFENLANLLWI